MEREGHRLCAGDRPQARRRLHGRLDGQGAAEYDASHRAGSRSHRRLCEVDPAGGERQDGKEGITPLTAAANPFAVLDESAPPPLSFPRKRETSIRRDLASRW